MSDKLESEVYADFRKALEPIDVHIHRIENSVKSGTFDVAVSRSGRTMWVELKRSEFHQLKASQIRWSLDRYAVGCTRDMWVIAPRGSLWRIYSITEVLQANGILRDVKGATPAVPSEAMRAMFQMLFKGA